MIENSDYAVEATKFGISRAGDWGYVGVSVDSLESLYGIPFHGMSMMIILKKMQMKPQMT